MLLVAIALLLLLLLLLLLSSQVWVKLAVVSKGGWSRYYCKTLILLYKFM